MGGHARQIWRNCVRLRQPVQGQRSIAGSGDKRSRAAHALRPDRIPHMRRHIQIAAGGTSSSWANGRELYAGDVRCTTALPPKADVHPRSCYVAFVPKAVVSRCSKMRRRNAHLNLLNDLVGEREQLVRHIKGNRLRSLEVDHKLELIWLLHG